MEQTANCFELLKLRWLAELTELGCPPPEIFFCHRWGERMEYPGRFAGFQGALDLLSQTPMPVLILGLQSEAIVRSVARAGDEFTISLLDTWSGAEYLRYDVSPNELRAAARRVIEGAKQPFPGHFSIQNPNDLLKLSSEIRHWLENRRTNVTGMLDDFRNVLRGDTISPFHLIPQPAVSEVHRKMVNRLWIYEPMAVKLTSANGGIAPLRASMAEFEQAWAEFEAVRESCREKVNLGEDSSEQTRVAISKLEAVIETVCKTIEVTRTLDAALQEKI
jgi:hypothetical protein